MPGAGALIISRSINTWELDLKRLTLAMIALLLTAHSASALTIRGARSCGDWVQGRTADRNTHAEAWLVGYLSGRAAASGVDLLKGTDNPSLFLWMDNFCRAQPLKDIEDGASELVPELARKARNR